MLSGKGWNGMDEMLGLTTKDFSDHFFAGAGIETGVKHTILEVAATKEVGLRCAVLDQGSQKSIRHVCCCQRMLPLFSRHASRHRKAWILRWQCSS